MIQRTNFLILFVLTFFIHCKSDKDSAQPEIENKVQEEDLIGSYEGYKILNKSLTDSVAVSLKVEKKSAAKFVVTEIRPFAHYFDIELTGSEFTYDRGTGEDECGATKMTGNGYFKGRNLYFIETTKCVKLNSADKHVEYRVVKK